MKSTPLILKIVFWSLFGFALSSCMPSSKSQDPAPIDGLVDVTNRASCEGPTMNISPNNVAWSQRLTNSATGQIETRIYYFSGNTMSLSTICSEQGNDIPVLAQASIVLEGSRISILFPDTQSKTVTMGGKTRTCTSQIPQQTWTFALRGDCLLLSKPEGILTLPRYTGN